MFCPNCHETILGTEKYCSNCGFMLRNPNTYNYDVKIKHVNENNNLPSQKVRKKKKNPIFIIIFFIVITVSLVLFLNKDYFLSKGKRTIMIYIVGSDLESKYYSASSDIYEMMTSGADFENINLLLYTGGAKSWYKDNISSNENAIYKVEKNEIVKLESYPLQDMGNSDTLLSFINYGYDNYKAEKYSLILWDHGGGPIYGFGLDEHNKLNYLSLLELKEALRFSPFSEKNKLEFIGFDACLMSSIETSSVIKDYADYMIASEEVEPGGGWNYSFLSNINKNSSSYDIGKNIVDTYNDYYGANSLVNGTSLALIDLAKEGKVEENLNELFKDVDSDLVFNFTSISRSRSITKTYGKTTTISYDLVDLYDLVSSLPSKYDDKKEKLIDSLKDFVKYQKTDLDGTNGISIYFPYENRSKLNTIMTIYKNFNFASNYTDFIENFASKLSSYSYSYNFYRNMPISEKNELTLQIDGDAIDNVAKANYLIFEKDGDYFIPRYKGMDFKVDGNVITAELSKKAIVAHDKEGNYLYLTAFEKEKNDEYTKYIIPATVQNWTNEDLSDFEILPIYVEFVVTKSNPSGVITSAYSVDENTNLSSKVGIDIYKWKLIQFVNAKYKIFDENGNYSTNWQVNGDSEVIALECNTDDVEIEFTDLDSSKEYYAVLNVVDVKGVEYSTEVVKINEQ